MSAGYGRIAFTKAVQDEQEHHGSRRFYARHQARAEQAGGQGRLTGEICDYLAERDSFYLASVSETGWPYVQFRGGPAGFLTVLSQDTVGWADFRGNLQYISTGNLRSDDRVALIVMDYPNRQQPHCLICLLRVGDLSGPDECPLRSTCSALTLVGLSADQTRRAERRLLARKGSQAFITRIAQRWLGPAARQSPRARRGLTEPALRRGQCHGRPMHGRGPG